MLLVLLMLLMLPMLLVSRAVLYAAWVMVAVLNAAAALHGDWQVAARSVDADWREWIGMPSGTPSPESQILPSEPIILKGENLAQQEMPLALPPAAGRRGI